MKGLVGFWTALAVTLTIQGTASAELMSEERRVALCKEAAERYETLDVEKPKGDAVAVVLMYKYNFCPRELTVKKGTTIHFINVDKRTSHSVWFREAGKEESVRMFPEEGWTTPMLAEGEFPYLCGPHGEQEQMTGKVTVTP